MAVDDHLRPAPVHACRDGREALREAMLMSHSSAESGAWGRLGRTVPCPGPSLERPNHILGAHPALEPDTWPTLRRGGDPDKLRGQYPPGRVGWLRVRAEASPRGPMPAEGSPPLSTILDALVGPPAEAEVRRDPAESVRGPLARSRVEVAAGATPAGPLPGRRREGRRRLRRRGMGRTRGEHGHRRR